jgi:Kdo2-lipid IVA lauroyltransferase/acyltransferase
VVWVRCILTCLDRPDGVMKHFTEYLLVRIVSGVVRLLPRRARLAVGRALGGLVYAVDARHRRVTLANVEMAFGNEKTDEEKRAIARGAFRHFGAMLVEMITLRRPSREDLDALVEFEGVENVENARAQGKGVILVAAHFGNWELHAIAHGFRLGRLFLVAREQDNGYLNRWLEDIRRTSGNEIVYKQRALGQMRRLMRRGECVAFVIDQNVHLEDAVFVDFFGRKAATTPVASWFALKTGAALVPVFCFPLPDGRYRAVYEKPLDMVPYRDMDRADAIALLTQELASLQERYIRKHPEIWLWMHRRWRTRPPEERNEAHSPSVAERVEEAALT